MKIPWAKRHSLEGTKNLSGVLKDGAQSEYSLKPCSVIVELSLVTVWTAGVRRRRGMGVPGRERTKKAWFLPPPENPAQPTSSSYTATSDG